jgi:U3 small nucleolar RNA-associated protein 10
VARVQDTHIGVLEALYENPAALTPVFASNPKEYLASLAATMGSQTKPKRNILRLHLTYLASSFWSVADLATQEEIFHQGFFPFLLFSRPRQKTADLVWDIVITHLLQSSGSIIAKWLAGCAAFVKADTVSEDADAYDQMNQTNFNVAGKIAGRSRLLIHSYTLFFFSHPCLLLDNIIASDRLEAYVDSVISKLQDSQPHVKLLGHLIATSLIKKLSGVDQVEIARKILSLMRIDELSGIDDTSQEYLTLDVREKSWGLLCHNVNILSNQATDDIPLGKYIILKPASKTTLNWLQISIIAAISRIPKPIDMTLDWISESVIVSTKLQAHI